MKFSRSKSFRKIVITLAVLLVVGGGYYLLRYQAWAAYRSWSITRMNHLAEEFMAAEDPRSALLTVRKVLRKRPNDVVALRLAVAATNRQGAAETVLFQRNLSRIEPSAGNTLELLRLALRYEAYRYAVEAIEKAGLEVAQLPEFHRLAIEVYRPLERHLALKFHYISLLSLLPEDFAARVGLAEVEFALAPDQLPADWLARVRDLEAEPTVARAAQFLQLRHAVATANAPAAARFAALLQDRDDLVLAERLQLLAAIRLYDAPAAAARLVELQAANTDEPGAVAEIMEFLAAQAEPQGVHVWYGTLPDGIRQDERVRMVAALARLELADWAGLEALLRGPSWKVHETRRLTLLARVYRERGRAVDFAETWKLALIAADRNDLNGVVWLLRTVESWHWDAERTDVLWKLFNLIPGTVSVQQQLIAREFLQGNTANLNRIFARILEVSPDDAEAGNNFAYTSLLLNVNPGRAQTLARDLHWRHPTNNSYRTTYAFALFKQGAYHEALALLGKLDNHARYEPGARLQEALSLAALGEGARTTDLLRELTRVQMLPEERNLLTKAAAEIRQIEISAGRTQLVARSAGAPLLPGGWLELLPEPLAPTTDLQLADTYYREKNYAALQQLLEDRQWSGPPHLRLGLQAYLQRHDAAEPAARELWRQAGAAAGRDARRIRDLEALALHWEWVPERMEIAGRRFESDPSDQALLTELLGFYRGENRTPEMARILWLFVNRTDATGPEAAWCVYYSLLCNLNVTSAQTLAARMYAAAPRDGRHRVAYAFALWRQQRAAEAWPLLLDADASRLAGMQADLIATGVLLELDRQPEAEVSLGRFVATAAVPEEIALADALARRIARDNARLAAAAQ